MNKSLKEEIETLVKSVQVLSSSLNARMDSLEQLVRKGLPADISCEPRLPIVSPSVIRPVPVSSSSTPLVIRPLIRPAVTFGNITMSPRPFLHKTSIFKKNDKNKKSCVSKDNNPLLPSNAPVSVPVTAYSFVTPFTWPPVPCTSSSLNNTTVNMPPVQTSALSFLSGFNTHGLNPFTGEMVPLQQNITAQNNNTSLP